MTTAKLAILQITFKLIKDLLRLIIHDVIWSEPVKVDLTP
jgi:hypothetical protein